MNVNGLTPNTRKALRVHIGDAAGAELAVLIQSLVQRVEELERNKVDVTWVAPDNSPSLLGREGRRAA